MKLSSEALRAPPGARQPPHRRPLGERRRSERARARIRIATRTRNDLSEAQRARDPLPPLRPPRSAALRTARLFALTLGALGVHGAVVGVGLLIGGREPGRREVVRQEVKIEVQERKVEPPPKPVEKPPEPERAIPVPPKVVKAPPPPKAAPEPPKGPPPRIVGLSLESTVEGGSGPAFAVGNTRDGETAERAVTPAAVAPVAPPPPPPPTPAAAANKAATRIPVAGVKHLPPKKKQAVEPHYPETLKSQGIEADVPLMVSIDETGKVTAVKVLRPSPYPELDEEARKAAFAEEYEPATRDGVPFATSISFTTRFRLEVAP
jgi:protein TonB